MADRGENRGTEGSARLENNGVFRPIECKGKRGIEMERGMEKFLNVRKYIDFPQNPNSF